MATDTPKPVDPVDDSAFSKGWTVQSGEALQAPEAVPGNVVLYGELPWEDSLKSAGIDPEQYRGGLVIAKDEGEKRKILAETEAKKAQPRKGSADANSPAAAEGDTKASDDKGDAKGK